VTAVHAAHTIAAPAEAVWYRDRATGIEHAYAGIHRECDRRWWTAALAIVGPIEAVDRAAACEPCLVATGSTEAELAGGFGK